MKDLLKKPFTFEKLEFWVATSAYIFALFVFGNKLVKSTMYNVHVPDKEMFDQYHLHYSYSKYYFIPQACKITVYYCSFLLLNFYVIKSLLNFKRVILNIVLLIIMFISAVTALSAADTWINSYLYYNHSDDYVFDLVFNREFIFGIWVIMLFGLYTFIRNITKYSIDAIFASSNFEQVARECMVALLLWILSTVFMKLNHASWNEIISWSEVIVLGIAIYWYSFYAVIPDVLAKKETFKSYILKVSQILVISFIPVALFAFIIFKRGEASIALNLFNIGLNLFIVAPFSWYLYQHRYAKNKELYGLKTALGRSNADLDFLRSQINPHFLFNALNTLYATALQESADRTAEGIQKLGDMMRFMLQENMQEKISLNREVDYLNNYIDLQKLRTQTSPDIIIKVEIEDHLYIREIAPMLLIPFVENAFKHGISLREASHINIALHVEGGKLLFDVYNSIHLKAGHDPEKDKSGIGLENVKQRLQLLYPDNHELIIHQNTREFFIHLSVTL